MPFHGEWDAGQMSSYNADETQILTAVDEARKNIVRRFIDKMKSVGYAEHEIDHADFVVQSFLRYADLYGWRLDSYLVGKDYENQLNKGEK
jgi:hypothetical protein